MDIESTSVKFDMLDLPDLPLEIILEYLDFESKKNLRLVGRDFADFVMKLDPGLRTWKIDLIEEKPSNLYKFMGIAKYKGVTDLKHFKLNISFAIWKEFETQYRQIIPEYPFSMYEEFICTWKDHIVALDVEITAETKILSTLKFPQLEKLRLSRDEECNPAQFYLIDLLCNHSDTLKNLRMEMGYMGFLWDNIVPALHLESLSF